MTQVIGSKPIVGSFRELIVADLGAPLFHVLIRLVAERC